MPGSKGDEAGVCAALSSVTHFVYLCAIALPSDKMVLTMKWE